MRLERSEDSPWRRDGVSWALTDMRGDRREKFERSVQGHWPQS